VTGCHILRANQALILITRVLPSGCAMLYYKLDAEIFHKTQLTSHTEHRWCSTASLTSKHVSHELMVRHVGRQLTSHSTLLPCHPQALWMVISPHPKEIKHLTFNLGKGHSVVFKVH
jgi:hypothetical protein